jgi:hypothetical protein
MFSRGRGGKPARNAIEYGHVCRVGVRSRHAVEGLGLASLLAGPVG